MSAVIWRSGDGGGAHPHAHPDAYSGQHMSLVVAMPYL
jgi:hypothetical protein